MTITYSMPRSPEIGTVGTDGRVQLNEPYHRYFGAIEKLDGRVAASLESTATTAEIIAALKAAGLMRNE